MNVIDVPTRPRNFAADEVILKLFYVIKYLISTTDGNSR